jgi:hypothetical protein
MLPAPHDPRAPEAVSPDPPPEPPPLAPLLTGLLRSAGAQAARAVDGGRGAVLAEVGLADGDDVPALVQLVQAATAAGRGRGEWLEDLVVTLGRTVHVLRDCDGVVLHMRLDPARGDVGAVRRGLAAADLQRAAEAAGRAPAAPQPAGEGAGAPGTDRPALAHGRTPRSAAAPTVPPPTVPPPTVPPPTVPPPTAAPAADADRPDAVPARRALLPRPGRPEPVRPVPVGDPPPTLRSAEEDAGPRPGPAGPRAAELPAPRRPRHSDGLADGLAEGLADGFYGGLSDRRAADDAAPRRPATGDTWPYSIRTRSPAADPPRRRHALIEEPEEPDEPRSEQEPRSDEEPGSDREARSDPTGPSAVVPPPSPPPARSADPGGSAADTARLWRTETRAGAGHRVPDRPDEPRARAPLAATPTVPGMRPVVPLPRQGAARALASVPAHVPEPSPPPQPSQPLPLPLPRPAGGLGPGGRDPALVTVDGGSPVTRSGALAVLALPPVVLPRRRRAAPAPAAPPARTTATPAVLELPWASDLSTMHRLLAGLERMG